MVIESGSWSFRRSGFPSWSLGTRNQKILSEFIRKLTSTSPYANGSTKPFVANSSLC